MILTFHFEQSATALIGKYAPPAARNRNPSLLKIPRQLVKEGERLGNVLSVC